MKKSELKQLIRETVDDLVYSNELVSSDPSIDTLLKTYADDYIEFVDRGTVKFFDYGDTYKFSFDLKFPRKKVEFKSLNILYQTVSKALNFSKTGKTFGIGKISKVTENDNFFILNFTLRGGK